MIVYVDHTYNFPPALSPQYAREIHPESADMYDTPHYDRRSIDRDHYEPSPSTGFEETAEVLHAPQAHTVEPPDTGQFVVMIRTDPPERYRREHQRGVSS